MTTGTTGTTVGALDVTCPAAPTVAAEARRRIGLRLSAWGLSRLAGDVESSAAELIANACAAVPEGHIRVRFVREARSVLLAVWDGSDLMPEMRPLVELRLDDLDLSEEALDDNGGWGLHIVRSLASECGVRRTRPTGKWVWAGFSF